MIDERNNEWTGFDFFVEQAQNMHWKLLVLYFRRMKITFVKKNIIFKQLKPFGTQISNFSCSRSKIIWKIIIQSKSYVLHNII